MDHAGANSNVHMSKAHWPAIIKSNMLTERPTLAGNKSARPTAGTIHPARHTVASACMRMDTLWHLSACAKVDRSSQPLKGMTNKRQHR
eukprot:1442205-Alexandrium_andersonii.AAC.2